MRFHHVGYAVASIRAYLDDFFLPLMQPVSVSAPVSDPIQNVTVCFAHMQGGTVVELVEPLGDRSPVREIIGSRRGGLYHVCYEVEDIDDQVRRFRAQHCLPLAKPQPAAAFEGRRIVFLMTPQFDLIELLEGRRA